MEVNGRAYYNVVRRVLCHRGLSEAELAYINSIKPIQSHHNLLQVIEGFVSGALRRINPPGYSPGL